MQQTNTGLRRTALTTKSAAAAREILSRYGDQMPLLDLTAVPPELTANKVANTAKLDIGAKL